MEIHPISKNVFFPHFLPHCNLIICSPGLPSVEVILPCFSSCSLGKVWPVSKRSVFECGISCNLLPSSRG